MCIQSTCTQEYIQCTRYTHTKMYIYTQRTQCTHILQSSIRKKSEVFFQFSTYKTYETYKSHLQVLSI